MLVRNAAAVAVKNFFPAVLDHPVPVPGKQLPGNPVLPVFFIRFLIRRGGNEGLLHKNVDGVHAARRGMRQIIFHQLPAQARKDVVEHAGTVDDVELFVQPEGAQIGLKKADFHLVNVGQPLRLLDSGGRRVKGRDLIAAFCQKNRILPFSAADFQQAQGSRRINPFQ